MGCHGTEKVTCWHEGHRGTRLIAEYACLSGGLCRIWGFLPVIARRPFWKKTTEKPWTRWWFQTFFIFIPTWWNDPNGLIFFRWVVQPPTSGEVLPYTIVLVRCKGSRGPIIFWTSISTAAKGLTGKRRAVVFRIVFKDCYQKLPFNWVVATQIFLFSSRKLGKWSNLTNIFQMGWNHQLAKVVSVLSHQISIRSLLVLWWGLCLSLVRGWPAAFSAKCFRKYIICLQLPEWNRRNTQIYIFQKYRMKKQKVMS